MAWSIGSYQGDGWDIGSWQDDGLVAFAGINNHVSFVNRKVWFYNNSLSDNFYWQFGDGTTSTKRNPFHIYTKAGVYDVSIIVDGIEYNTTNQAIIFENSFIMDSGAVYLNYGEKNETLLGATEGGNKFGIENDYRYMTFDGVQNSALVNAHRLVGSIPKIIANIKEINYRLLNIALPGSDITFNSGSVIIQRAIKRLIENDYIKNIAIVAEHGGTGCFIVFKILNSITLENIEIPFEDSNESVIECTFAGCFCPDNLDSESWEIDSLIVN